MEALQDLDPLLQEFREARVEEALESSRVLILARFSVSGRFGALDA